MNTVPLVPEGRFPTTHWSQVALAVDLDPKQHTRRSLYLFVKRHVRLPMLEAFDQPDTLNSCAFRPVSTFAPQALILMNGPFARQQAQRLAVRLTREAGADRDRQVERAYRLLFARSPSDTVCELLLTNSGRRESPSAACHGCVCAPK